jgi:hypothetical protein
MRKEGRNSFFHYRAPKAIIRLKQGIGRVVHLAMAKSCRELQASRRKSN